MPEYPQPGAEQRSQQHFIIFDRFKALNTQSARTGLPNDQLAWLENLQPLAENKLQIVPAPLPPAVTISENIVLEFYAAMKNQDWLILFTTAGAGFYYNITTGASGQFAPDGTFSTAPDCTTWQAARILINDSIAGYCTWDGTLFVQQGGVSPNIEVTNGGVNYLVAPTVTITTAQAGSGATAVASVANGRVVAVQLTNAGDNYAAGDDIFVNFSSLGGTGATFNVVMQTTGLGAVQITSVGQWGPGNGPGAGFYPLVVSGGGGSGAQATGQVLFNAALNAFYVGNVTVNSPGGGYSSLPSVSWNFGAFPIIGAGPFFAPVMNNQGVASVAVSAGGSGYPPSATMPLIFTGGSGSPQATGTATSNSSGVVTSASLTASGSYPFLNRPSVAVARGSGATAAAHVWPFVTAGTTLAVFQGRVFLGGGQLLQWSGTGATAGYNKQGFDDFLVADLSGALGISDADLVHNITALRAFNNYLWIVGDQSIKQIGSLFPSGAPPFQLLTLSSDQGTIWPKSCISYNRIFLFANPNGIFGVFGSTVQKISDDLDGIFQNANFTQQPQGAVVDLNSKHNAVFLLRYNDPVAGTRSLLLMFDGKRWWFANQGAGLVAIATAPIFATDINQLWGSTTGADVTHLLADPATAVPFKLSTALAHADNPVQGKRLLRAGFTARVGAVAQVNMLLEAEVMSLARVLAVGPFGVLVGGANDANNNPLSITGIYLGATLTGTLANFILQNVMLEYQETSLWKTGVSLKFLTDESGKPLLTDDGRFITAE